MLSAVDSQTTVTEIRRDPIIVPESKVTVEIPVDSLSLLPAGAGYTRKSGQAGVHIERKTDTASGGEVIVVEATCDSLQLVCESYLRTISSLKRALAASKQNSTSNETVIKQQLNGIWYIVAAASFIISLSAIISVILKTKKT